MKLYVFIPNILSILRIAASPFFIVFYRDKPIAFCIALFCGITDVLDGIIARKLHICSDFGAKLDSLSDAVFFISIAVSFIIFERTLLGRFIPAVCVIAAVRILSALVCYIQNKEIYSLHTYANKAAGLSLIISVFVFLRIESAYVFYPAAALCFLSAAEELAVFIRWKKPDKNLRSFFLRDRD